ncbi:MAG: hypothetical protein U1E27_12600, partial [Kiritimatiellia bacterium]|nr:hypothetical protein [Kiritimatiellia bacterium]
PPARPAPVQPADPDEDADDGEETSPTEFSGTGVVPTDGESLAADWPRITGELRSVVLKLGTLLHGSRILKIGQDFVEIGVDPARVPDLANAMDSRGQLAVEQALSRKLNRSVSARLVHAVPLAAAAPAALAGPGATAHPTIAPAGPMDPKTPKKSESVLNHPDAHKVINLFGGSLVDDSPK